MEKWLRDPWLRQLVAERREQGVGRREFLARLGGVAAGVAGASVVGRSKPAGAQTKVVVTTWDTEPNPKTRAVMKEIVADFQKLHKDVEVRAEGMGWADMDRKLLAGLAAKTPPTLSHSQQYVVTTFRSRGIIEPLDDVAQAIGKDRILPSVRRWLEYDGKIWGLTHAWGAEMLGGRADWAREAGVNPMGWKTWDDWLRDMPKLNKPPGHFAFTLAGGHAFTLNEDVYMWVGSNGGRLFDDQGGPTLETPQVIEMLEFWKKLKPYLPTGWTSHSFLETLAIWTSGKAAQNLIWGRTAEYVDLHAPPDKRNPDVFAIWPKTIGPSGTAPITQFDNEPWIAYADVPKAEKAAGREFLKFFYKKENYRKYCDSVPLHLLSIFAEDFKDPSYLNHPDRVRWKPWLEAQQKWVEQGRTFPLLMTHANDMNVKWIGDVGASTILADMAVAVVERGKSAKEAAKEAQTRILRDIVEKARRG
jgi:ABC-type glycerol-3-phosphate transport system substrate-binding protein